MAVVVGQLGTRVAHHREVEPRHRAAARRDRSGGRRARVHGVRAAGVRRVAVARGWRVTQAGVDVAPPAAIAAVRLAIAAALRARLAAGRGRRRDERAACPRIGGRWARVGWRLRAAAGGVRGHAHADLVALRARVGCAARAGGAAFGRADTSASGSAADLDARIAVAVGAAQAIHAPEVTPALPAARAGVR